MITEENYPLLQWTGYGLDWKPDTLRVGAIDEKGQDYMRNSLIFQTLLTLFDADRYAGSSLKEKITYREPLPPGLFRATNFYLPPKVFHTVDSDMDFRLKAWRSVNRIPSGTGSIAFKAEGHYTYRIITADDALVLLEGGYLSKDFFMPGKRLVMAGLFSKDSLMGFEWGWLGDNGPRVSEDGYYPYPEARVGMYLSFSLITLSAWMNNKFAEKRLKPGQGINQTRQPVIVLNTYQ